MPPSMRPRLPVPPLWATLASAGSSEAILVRSFCQLSTSMANAHCSTEQPILRATAGSVLPCRIRSYNRPWSQALVTVTSSSRWSAGMSGRGTEVRCTVSCMPSAWQKSLTSSRPIRSITMRVHTLSLTMIICTRASRSVMVKPGVKNLNVPETTPSRRRSSYRMGSLRSSLPRFTSRNTAIMIATLRVLPVGKATCPPRSASSPVTRFFTYQEVAYGCSSQMAFKRTTSAFIRHSYHNRIVLRVHPRRCQGLSTRHPRPRPRHGP